MVIAFPIMVATLVAGNGIDVRSASDCPSSEAIQARLRPLLSGVGEADDTAWVEAAGSGPNGRSELHVRLVRPDASVVADRRLSLQGGCDEMADTVATVLAAWETPQASQPSQSIDLSAHAIPPTEPARATRRRTDLRLGASGGAGFVGGAAATGSLELLVGRAGSHAQGRAAVVGQTSRDRNLDPGSVVWRRTHASLGLGWKAAATSWGSFWQASADAGLLLGWLTASGQGFPANQREDVFEYGAGAALRGERSLGGWGLWLECRASFWARPERAVLSNSPSSTADLPRFEVVAALGISRLVIH